MSGPALDEEWLGVGTAPSDRPVLAWSLLTVSVDAKGTPQLRGAFFSSPVWHLPWVTVPLDAHPTQWPRGYRRPVFSLKQPPVWIYYLFSELHFVAAAIRLWGPVFRHLYSGAVRAPFARLARIYLPTWLVLPTKVYSTRFFMPEDYDQVAYMPQPGRPAEDGMTCLVKITPSVCVKEFGLEGAVAWSMADQIAYSPKELARRLMYRYLVPVYLIRPPKLKRPLDEARVFDWVRL